MGLRGNSIMATLSLKIAAVLKYYTVFRTWLLACASTYVYIAELDKSKTYWEDRITDLPGILIRVFLLLIPVQCCTNYHSAFLLLGFIVWEYIGTTLTFYLLNHTVRCSVWIWKFSR